jgi:heptosyltransferase I
MSPLSRYQHAPPSTVCILRLSALGDACHALAVLRALQAAWPATRYTWIIGTLEHRLLGLVPEVEFISYDKRGGAAELLRLRRVLRMRSFDVLLHMQLAIRASLIASLVRAPVKLGYDRPRARELQWLFTTERIAPAGNQHVQDALYGFAAALGVPAGEPRWDIPLPPAAHAAAERLAGGQPTLVISPSSSHPARNWHAAGYAAVADHAQRAHGLKVILCGGPGEAERALAAAIEAASALPLVNHVGKDTLPELLALLARARALLSPDSGPVHLANAVGTPVIGLYAATNPARSGPYRHAEHCVDRYPEAARRFLGCEPGELPWATKIERPGVMDLIEPAAVIGRLDALLRGGGRELR